MQKIGRAPPAINGRRRGIGDQWYHGAIIVCFTGNEKYHHYPACCYLNQCYYVPGLANGP
jgi:hypothetical protein